MTDIKWQDPPPPKRGRQGFSKWNAIADALREHPGQWALITQTVQHGVGTAISSARWTAFQPAGSFEATTRTVGYDGDKPVFEVYARFVGEAGEYK